MGTERRRYTRHRICFPVRLDSEAKHDRIGMCRNGSGSGMLLGTPSRFKPGDRLLLSFRVSSLRDPEQRVEGRVVRVLVEDGNADSWCRRLVAIEFDQPRDELDHLFAREAPRQEQVYGRSA